MAPVLVALSSALALISYVVYIAAILRGRAKPHRTTRFVLVIITALATASLIAQGSTTAVWLSGIFTVGSLSIFLLTIKYGMGGWSKIDLTCLTIALAGIVYWQVTANPLYGLVASILSDLVGQIPMLVKTFKFPETEVWTFYAIDVLAAVFSLSAISNWNFMEYSYPLYIVFIDGTTILLILRRQIQAKLAG